MDPSDSYPGRRMVICSHTPLMTCSSRAGLPGSSADLSVRAVPNHPGRPEGCIRSLLHPRRLASHTIGRLATLQVDCLRGRIGFAFATARTFATRRISRPPGSCPLRYLLNEQFTGQAPFSLLDQTGLSWRFQSAIRTPHSLVAVYPMPATGKPYDIHDQG